MSLGAAWCAVDNIMCRLVSVRCRVIRMRSMAGMFDVRQGFAAKGVQGAIDALDGCHIEILRPQENEQAYVNRKGYHSINLMARGQGPFTIRECSATARWVDAWPWWITANECCQADAFIIGDAAFQLSTYMIILFRDNQVRAQRDGQPTPQQKKYFNQVLSGARVCVEHTFGVVKSRFRRLTLVETKTVERAVRLVTAVCVLHNICVANDDDAFPCDNAAENAPVEDDDARADVGGADGVAAVQKRYRLVEEMWAARQQ